MSSWVEKDGYEISIMHIELALVSDIYYFSSYAIYLSFLFSYLKSCTYIVCNN